MRSFIGTFDSGVPEHRFGRRSSFLGAARALVFAEELAENAFGPKARPESATARITLAPLELE